MQDWMVPEGVSETDPLRGAVDDLWKCTLQTAHMRRAGFDHMWCTDMRHTIGHNFADTTAREHTESPPGSVENQRASSDALNRLWNSGQFTVGFYGATKRER